jgi:hypothetical protein
MFSFKLDAILHPRKSDIRPETMFLSERGYQSLWIFPFEAGLRRKTCGWGGRRGKPLAIIR